ncbi:indole-3-glycerol-phosphate synthase [Aureococcus anophagefferens]|nr:indole-3-glycerol-phosphate synthase [Aureococcus anophagefferens]
MLPAAAGARMSQCNEIGRGLIWAQIESIGTDYYYVCLVTGEYWEYTNTLGNRTVYGSANAEAEASDFHAACAAACAAANVTRSARATTRPATSAPTGLLHGDGRVRDCRESTLYPAAEETGAWSLPVWDECVGCPDAGLVVAATRLFDENGTAVGVAGSDVSMDSFSVLLKSWRDVFAPHHVVFIVSARAARRPGRLPRRHVGGAPVVAWANGTEHGNGTKYRVRAVDSASAVVAGAVVRGRDYEDDRLYGPLDWHMVFVQDVACAGFTYADPGLGRCEPCEWPYLSRSGVDCDMPAPAARSDGGGAGDLCGSKYEGRLCSACGGYRWKTMAGKCRNCGAYEAIASIALYFVGTVAVANGASTEEQQQRVRVMRLTTKLRLKWKSLFVTMQILGTTAVNAFSWPPIFGTLVTVATS